MPLGLELTVTMFLRKVAELKVVEETMAQTVEDTISSDSEQFYTVSGREDK
jgi:hypothetical protein